MTEDPAAVRLDVVGRHRQDRLGARLDHPLGQLGGVARVVRAGAGDHRALRPDLLDDELDQPDQLVVRERRPLPGRAGEHEAMRAAGQQVARERDGGFLVDLAVRVERRCASGAKR